jgi:hypothetical protein
VSKRVPDEQFVLAWMAYESVPEVALHLGWEWHAVVKRAHTLRKRGVNLPKKHRGPRARNTKEHVASLNKLIAEQKP